MEDDPNRFVAMKTKKKKAKIRSGKEILDISQIAKAKDILERSIIDGQYHLNMT